MEKLPIELDFNPFMRVHYVLSEDAGPEGTARAEIRIDAHENGPPLHYHPLQQEGFNVISGTLDFFMDNKWVKIGAGQSILVSPNIPHTFKNSTDTEVVFINTHQPALNFVSFMRKFHSLIHSGKLSRKINLSTLLYLSILWIEHEQDLISVKPPRFMLSSLARLGKILGYKLE